MKKTPLDVNSLMRLTGEAEVATGDGGTDSTPVRATSTTHADSALSTSDVVLFQNSSCLLKDPDGNAPDCVSADDPEDRLLAAGTDVFATDRQTALAVNDFENLPADATPKEGLVNKFPFDTKQENYPFWDGYSKQAVDAAFDGVEDIDGLETYRFKVVVPETNIEVSAGAPGTYTTEKTMWVEPKTGSIIHQAEHQVRKMANGDPFLDLNFAFTEETVANNVESAKANVSKLGLLDKGPWLLGILGLLSLVAGAFLARGAGREPGAAVVADDSYVDDSGTTYVEEAPATEELPTYEDRTNQFFEEAEGQNYETRAARREAEGE